jgi:hypothetical protein
MSDDEENNSKEPEDFTVEELAQLNIDSAPLIEAFYEIYTKEMSVEDQVKIYKSKGVPGALGELINQSIPPQLFELAPWRIVDLAQRAVLFGYKLDEINKRVFGTSIETSELSIDDLDTLWDIETDS